MFKGREGDGLFTREAIIKPKDGLNPKIEPKPLTEEKQTINRPDYLNGNNFSKSKHSQKLNQALELLFNKLQEYKTPESLRDTICKSFIFAAPNMIDLNTQTSTEIFEIFFQKLDIKDNLYTEAQDNNNIKKAVNF